MATPTDSRYSRPGADDALSSWLESAAGASISNSTGTDFACEFSTWNAKRLRPGMSGSGGTSQYSRAGAGASASVFCKYSRAGAGTSASVLCIHTTRPFRSRLARVTG